MHGRRAMLLIRRHVQAALYAPIGSRHASRCFTSSSSTPSSFSFSSPSPPPNTSTPSSISSATPFTSCGQPSASLLPLLSGYGGCITFPIHWGDMDAFGHVNNVQFVRYIESGRVAALTDMAAQQVAGITQSEMQRALAQLMSGRGTGVILKSVNVKYKRPLTYPDCVTVGTALTQLSDDRFTLSHVIVSARQQAVVAEGGGTLVCYDYSKKEKTALPALVHTAIAQWGQTYGGRVEEQTNNKHSDNAHP